MKKQDYKKKDGSAGTSYALEAGDEFKALYASPRESLPGKSKYPSYSLKVLFKGKEIYLTLTAGQFKRLMGMGNLEGKQFVCIKYKGDEGKELLGIDEA